MSGLLPTLSFFRVMLLNVSLSSDSAIEGLLVRSSDNFSYACFIYIYVSLLLMHLFISSYASLISSYASLFYSYVSLISSPES